MGPQNNTSTVIYPPSSFRTVPFASPFFDSDLSKSIFIVMVISLLSEDDHVCGCMDVWVLVSWETCILTRNDACHNHFGWKGVNLFSHVDRRRGTGKRMSIAPMLIGGWNTRMHTSHISAEVAICRWTRNYPSLKKRRKIFIFPRLHISWCQKSFSKS